MKIYHGIGISGDIYIGKIRVVRRKEYNITPKKINNALKNHELKKLKDALQHATKQINQYINIDGLKQHDKEILETHLMILSDIDIITKLENLINQQCFTAAYAIYTEFENIIEHFNAMDNERFAQSASDYKDVAHQLLTYLLGDNNAERFSWKEGQIICLNDITPSLVTKMASSGVKAYVTVHGSYTSHSSILTRGLGLISLTAVGDILSELVNGQIAILDVKQGKFIVNPEKAVLEDYKRKIEKQTYFTSYINSFLNKPAITLNNKKILVKANIEYPEDVSLNLAKQCDGIGLFRTEFLYLKSTILPDEEKQTIAYQTVLQSLSDLPVNIRTFDLGGDKLSHLLHFKREQNPYLGCRGIRFSLAHIDIFKIQLRAILKASMYGEIRIMLPMVNGSEEVIKTREIISECILELQREGYAIKSNIPLGIMVETPSAVLNLKNLAKVCDFFSLGTNDLIQYTLAVDRNNDTVSHYYIPHHPAVLKLIKQTIINASEYHIPLSVCGEMASQPLYIPLLIGMGISELSVAPSQIGLVKSIINQCDKKLFDLVESFDFECDIKQMEEFINTYIMMYSHLNITK